MSKYEFIINFLKKYKKEILWWIFFIIFSQRIDYGRFAYTKEDYERDLRRKYKSDESDDKA